MKKLFLITMTMLLSVALFSQQLTYRFNNATLVGNTLEFDIEVKSDLPGFWIADNTVALDYGSAAFGSFAVPTNVTVTKGTLLQGSLFGTEKYELAGFANTFGNTMSFSNLTAWGALAPGVEPVPGLGYPHNEAPTVFTQMWHVVMTFLDVDQFTEIFFAEFLMDGQQYYQAAAGIQAPFVNPNLYENDLNQCFGNCGGCIPGLWTGAVDNNWENGLNWDCETVPGPGVDIVIPGDDTKSSSVVLSGGPLTIGSLTLGTNATLTLNPLGYLTATGNTSVGAGGKIVIFSDVAGNSGSFIDNGFLLGLGDFEFHRDVKGTFAPGANLGWHLISSPVLGFDSDAIWDYYLQYFNEPTSLYVPVQGVAPCIAVAPPVGMGEMEGWAVKYDENWIPGGCPGGVGTTIQFVGPIGNVWTGIRQGAYTAIGPDPNHYNMLGNPYPSSLDLDLTGWLGSVWTFSGLGWLPWNAGVGFNNIAPTQGFFINATVNGNFVVDNTMRTHGGTFQKSSVADVLHLQATGNGNTDHTFIRFLDEATPGFEYNWDAPKMMSNAATQPQIYTTNGVDKLSIDARPATSMVPMSFIAGVAGTYTIEAVETSEFQHVTLENVSTGEKTDLLTGSHTFSYTQVDEELPFIVHFAPLGTPEYDANSISIWAHDQKVYVQAPETNGDIIIYNMMGQEVIRTNIQSGLNVIPVDATNTYYVVKVIGSKLTQTGKVFIK